MVNLLRRPRSCNAAQIAHFPIQSHALSSKLATGAMLMGLAVSLTPYQPVQAAANISLEYGPIQRTLPFSELKTFAETGKSEGLIADLLQFAKQEPEKVQKMLTATLPIKVTTMDRLVNSYLGEVLLGQVGRIILPLGSTGSSVTPLKAALVGGIKNDQISVLSFIESYPVDMKVNGQEALAIKEQVEKDSKYLPEIVAGLQGMMSKLLPGFSLPSGLNPASSSSSQSTATPQPTPTP